MKQKACVKQQIMCDYDDSLFTRGRLESHLGSSYDWDRLTSVTNELDSMKRTTTFSTTFFFYIGEVCETFCLTFEAFYEEIEYAKKNLPLHTSFMFKVAIISHLHWHLLSDEGEVKSLRWLIIISKVPCHAADLNKRVWKRICMHLYAWAKRLMS